MLHFNNGIIIRTPYTLFSVSEMFLTDELPTAARLVRLGRLDRLSVSSSDVDEIEKP